MAFHSSDHFQLLLINFEAILGYFEAQKGNALHLDFRLILVKMDSFFSAALKQGLESAIMVSLHLLGRVPNTKNDDVISDTLISFKISKCLEEFFLEFFRTDFKAKWQSKPSKSAKWCDHSCEVAASLNQGAV